MHISPVSHPVRLVVNMKFLLLVEQMIRNETRNISRTPVYIPDFHIRWGGHESVSRIHFTNGWKCNCFRC